MKDAPRQQFRWAPHVSGAANAKPKDYDSADEVEAENEYAAWAVLRGSECPLGVGDILEDASRPVTNLQVRGIRRSALVRARFRAGRAARRFRAACAGCRQQTAQA